MKNIILGMILAILSYTTSISKEIELIIPQAPGSGSDILGKEIAAKYEEITGKKVFMRYLPGGEGAVGAAHFKKAHDHTMMLAGSTMLVYHPVMKKDLSYKDEDFKFYSWIASAYCVYVTRTDTGIKTIEDFVTKLPKSKKPFVGGYGPGCDLNVDIINKSGKSSGQLETVKFKSAPDTVLALLNGDVDVVNINIQSNLSQLVTEGKVHVIATTGPTEMTLADKKVPSISAVLKIPYLMSGWGLVIKPNADPALEKSLNLHLKPIMETSKLQDAVQKVFGVSGNVYGEKATKAFIYDLRKKFREFNTNP